MKSRRFLVVVVVAVLLGFAVLGSCWLYWGGGDGGGGRGGDGGDGNDAVGGLESGGLVEVVSKPTATPWPTFTAVPTATTRPTRVPRPTFTPKPTRVVKNLLKLGDVVGKDESGAPLEGVDDGVVATAAPTPGPTPYGQLYRGGVRLVTQSFFPLQSTELPDYLKEKRFELLPPPAEFVLSSVPFLMWGVSFDVSAAEEDFSMDGLIRWVQRSGPLGDAVMYENSVSISKEEPFFYTGLGDESGQLWKTGFYRVEFLDDRGRRAVSWEFEVR